MLTVIHGSDTAQSRKFFLDEKNKVEDAILLTADQVNLTDLAQVFAGGGLFGETKYVFIEQLIAKKKKSADYKDILAYLEKYSPEHTIMLWEAKELERGVQYEFKKAAFKVFNLPQTLFQLLDALKPNNGQLLIKLFHQTIETTEAEMVFFMLIRQIRILIALSSKNEIQTPIDEVKRLAPWQSSKLEQQAKSFGTNHLFALYDKLFAIERGQKTGTLATPLISAIDFFLLEV